MLICQISRNLLKIIYFTEFCPGLVYNLTVFYYNQTGPVYRDDLGWIPIQTRGQCGYPNNFFGLQKWNEYRNGFGLPGKKISFRSIQEQKVTIQCLNLIFAKKIFR